MRSTRSWVALGAAGLAMSATSVAMGVPAATAAPHSHHPAVAKHRATAKSIRGKQVGRVNRNSKITFNLSMALQHPAKARHFAMSVATPGSGSYRHFLTRKQWERRYGPSAKHVRQATHWLRAHHYQVHALPKDHLLIPVTGTAHRIERNFGARLGEYRVNGHRVRESSTALKVPHAIRGAVGAVSGVNQYIAKPALAQSTKGPGDAEPPPPAGFRNPQPCSAYWGEKKDTADSPSLVAPYSAPLPYDICGYTPAQLRGGYNINAQSSSLGKGTTIAIVDAYDSPTLLSDAQHYDQLNDPQYVLKASQFTDHNPGSVNDEAACAASGWYAEQSLDVESSHAMAPNANIAFFGADNCEEGLVNSLNDAVDSGADVVSNSWLNTLGDVFNDPQTIATYENIFSFASATGVSVMFSSGDQGDNFADFGIDAPDYPASDPLITAVGGTSLEVNRNGKRSGEDGWSTGKQVMCTSQTTTNCGSATTPAGPLLFNSGGGGGTSYVFAQPKYQAGVVPTSLSERNQALIGPVPTRTVPDISLDADAQTGMLIGLTQTFGNTVQYDQFKEGGTSLASPLLAGVTADAVANSGGDFGLLNPLIYKMDQRGTSGAIRDITAPTDPNSQATVRVDYANTQDASAGYIMSLRVLDYEGPETYCDGDGNCATRNVTLNARDGYDELTGVGSPGNRFVTQLSKF